MAVYDRWLAKGYLPDWLILLYIKYACQQRIRRGTNENIEEQIGDWQQLIQQLRREPIALASGESKVQHYEVPTAFFQTVLGPHLKYSSCLWEDSAGKIVDNLGEAETAMLQLTIDRAEIREGMHILDLGCGWGSFSLFIAQKFPGSTILAVSNSATQKTFIEQQAQARNLSNLTVLTSDINNLDLEEQSFDRVVSIEMFEHMRNYQLLFARIRQWLKPTGKLFVHIFTFDGKPYLYDAQDPNDWMAQNFFTGGTMPNPSLLLYFARDFTLTMQWAVNGKHYQKTLLAWLKNMDQNKKTILPMFEQTYGHKAEQFWHYWRTFFLSTSAVFGYQKGRYWFVSHYLFE